MIHELELRSGSLPDRNQAQQIERLEYGSCLLVVGDPAQTRTILGAYVRYVVFVASVGLCVVVKSPVEIVLRAGVGSIV